MTAKDGHAIEAWNAGHRLLREERYQDALGHFLRVVAIEPLDAAARIQLAQVQQRAGHYRDSHATVLVAADLRPSAPEYVLPLARLLRSFEETQRLDAIAVAEPWHAWRSADDLFALAREFATVGLHGCAEPLLDTLGKSEPDHLNAAYLRGAIAMFEGRIAQARQAFEHCLSLAPALPQARWMMSLLQKSEPMAGEADVLHRLLSRPGIASAQRAYLGYALHNRLHTLGRYDEAWAALETAWSAKRQLKPYDRDRQERLFAAIRATCDAAFVDAGAGDAAHATEGRVVFIVGLHRTGTTLLERMLGGHPQVREGGESYAFPVCLKLSADYATRDIVDEELVRRSPGIDRLEVADRFGDLMRWRSRGAAFVTEKLPGNFQLIGHILRSLPHAVVLHMVRDPMDTCFSNLRTYFDEAAPYATDPLDMAHYHGQYRALMAHWHAIAPGRILDVDYAQLTSQPRQVIGEVLDHCGLAFEEGVMQVDRTGGTVRTASMMEARLGIRTDRGGTWTPYREPLAAMRAALG